MRARPRCPVAPSLPVHALKIDRSFVQQLGTSREARAVVASIMFAARQLGLQTVAEGVETEDQVDLLKQLGCDEAQGFLFARPMAAQGLHLEPCRYGSSIKVRSRLGSAGLRGSA